MQGLRTQESSKFLRFFDLVQSKAKDNESIFFLSSGEGRDIITEEFEGEDLSGWLIPINKSSEFEKDFKLKKDVGNKWSDFFTFVVWEDKKGKLNIKFEVYNDKGEKVKTIE